MCCQDWNNLLFSLNSVTYGIIERHQLERIVCGLFTTNCGTLLWILSPWHKCLRFSTEIRQIGTHWAAAVLNYTSVGQMSVCHVLWTKHLFLDPTLHFDRLMFFALHAPCPPHNTAHAPENHLKHFVKSLLTACLTIHSVLISSTQDVAFRLPPTLTLSSCILLPKLKLLSTPCLP